ncbi:tyrosyl-tRNA synthetase [Tulasnella sp. UAMH 9824]|nr:tyrosyl-tRNA synthetase [Tulasnella sp. UAMH 9824]
MRRQLFHKPVRLNQYLLLRRNASTSSVITELNSRGLVAQTTSQNLEKLCNEQPITVYCGVDPSARSLHIGNLLPLITLLHFGVRGHKPIALIGGATGSIGDPGGRATERKLLSQEELAVNEDGITRQVHRFFKTATAYAEERRPQSTSGAQSPTVVNNITWFREMGMLEFLRTVGKHAKVNTMLSRDSVSSRLNASQGISFTEFTYQLLQAHDYYTLNKEYGCRLQIGGSDQWGNIVAGIDMIQRRRAATSSPEAVDHAESTKPEDEVFGLTIPLLTTPSGEKFGKSAGNAVWLDSELTSVYDFYQYFIRQPDTMVRQLLSMFTLLSQEKIHATMAEHEVDPSKRLAQRALAREVTELVHGKDAVRQAEAVTSVLFDSDVGHLMSEDVVAAFANDPRLVRLPSREEGLGVPLTKLLAKNGRVKSRSEAERVLKTGGMYLNSSRVTDPKRLLTEEDLVGNDHKIAVVRMGSDNHTVIILP